MTSQQLTFVGTAFSIGLSVLIVTVTAALGFYAWQRSGYRTAQGWLELLRTTIVIVIAVLLNQPEWVQQFRPDTKPAIAVLWDDSRSMQTRDVVPASTSESITIQSPESRQGEQSQSTGQRDPITRADTIKPLTQLETWRSLSEQLEVVIQPISGLIPKANEGDDESGTNLADPLEHVASQVDSLLGIVLVSDGDWNSGRPPVDIAANLRLKQVPIFTVPVGSPSRLPDVELTSVDLPTFGTTGKPVRIPFTIESSLPREYATTVTMTTTTGETLSRDVRIAPMGRTHDAFRWTPESAGDVTITVTVPVHQNEVIQENNARSAPIAIRQESLRVLIVESYPRWEYRYLRNALSRDPGIEVDCLLFHPDLDGVGGGSRDYIKVFPDTTESLSQYDVVFLGDVGLDVDQLTEQECDLIKGLVEHQASGLVFMPGLYGRQFSLLETELGELCPVVLDSNQPGGWGSRIPASFELTERGRASLLTKLADTEEDNAQVWEDLPGFQWHAPVLRAKAGSEVLAVHNEMSNQYGRIPLLVTRTFGAGKVLFMGTDGAWRWRKGVEDKYHYRFWGQVVRWMAYQRNMAKGETMRLFYAPDQPQVRQTLTLNAHVMDRSGEPLQDGDVVAQIRDPDGKRHTVRLISDGDQWGVFVGQMTPRIPGRHSLTLICQQTEATLETSFYVQGRAREQVGKPARPEVMEELARVSQGRSVTVDQIDDVMQSLAQLPLPPPSMRRVQLWNHPITAALVIGLLAVFWVLRKTAGLI